MEPVVQLRGAVTLLGRFPALAGIDLEVAAGEVLLLRGLARQVAWAGRIARERSGTG